MKEGLWMRYRRTLSATLLFVILPLFMELLIYLGRDEVYPGYLPFFPRVTNIVLVFLCFGLLFALASVLVAIPLAIFSARSEIVIPCGFFTLFSGLSMARLLPFDSGFSLPRIAAFTTAILLGATGFFLLRTRRDPRWRFLMATCLYCGVSAYLLPHLFELPTGTVFAGALVHALIFLVLFLVPLKVTAAVSLFLSIVFFPEESNIPRFARPNRIEPYRRVILVGIDGLSPEVLFQMTREGKLPACQQMINEGIAGTLHTFDVPFSPLIWNSIYTGTEPQRHGIMAFTYTRVLGAWPFLSLWLDEWTNSDWIHGSTGVLHRAGAVQILSPALSRSRLKPALWNIVDQNRLNSLVVGGWTTYPPEQIRGQYVSDLALMAGKNIPGTYYPENQSLLELLAHQPEISPWKEIQRYLSKDARTHRVATELLKENIRFSFVSTYYSSIDAFGHHYGTLIDMKSTSPTDREKYLKIREQLYRMIDQRLQDYLALVDDNTLLIVCSDHGWHFDKRQHNYKVDGALLIYGNRVRKHMNLEAGIYNIAPTVTYALGIAPSSDFQDVPLRQVFEGMIRKEQPRSYEPQKRFFELAGDKALEREKMEELEDLQYINR